MNEIRYVKIMLVMAAALVCFVAGINYVVNPMGVYGTPKIAGFNDVYPAATSYARLKKTEDVKRLKPEVVITGTSRADMGFDPRPEFFGLKRAYNIALPASTVYEQRRMLEFAQAVHPLKQAIITLDFFAFNVKRSENSQFDSARLSRPHSVLDTYSTIAALDTLIASRKHLSYIHQMDRRSQILPNGRKTNTDIERDIEKNGAYLRFVNPGNAAEISVDNFSFSFSDAPGDDVFKHVKAMLDMARQNGIDVILLIPPVHETYLDTLDKSAMTEMVVQWKKRLTEIARKNGADFNAAPYPLWDFAYKNPYTTETIPGKGDTHTPVRWFWDSNHMKPALGDLVLRKVLGLPGAPINLGKKLT